MRVFVARFARPLLSLGGFRNVNNVKIMKKSDSTRKSISAKSIADSISLIASIIGIFGFLTGISSIPSWLVSNNGDSDTATWFGGRISYSVSVPVFVITIVFIFGLYFIVAIRINKWLFAQGIIHQRIGDDFFFVETIIHNLSNSSDLFSLFCVVAVGSAIGYLIIRAFFGEDPFDTFLYTPGMFVFVTWLSLVAKNVATDLPQSNNESRSQPDWSTAIANVRLALSRMYVSRPEEIEIKEWRPQSGGKEIYLRVSLKERLWGKIRQSEYNVVADKQGKILKCNRTIEIV